MMRTPGTISGIVKDPKGSPVPNARVSFAKGPVPLPDIAALTDTGGTFVLSAPAPGAYTIEVFSEGLASRKIRITVTRGQEKHIVVSLSGKRESARSRRL